MNRTAPSIEDDSIARGNPTIDLDMASLDAESSIINDSVQRLCVFALIVCFDATLCHHFPSPKNVSPAIVAIFLFFFRIFQFRDETTQESQEKQTRTNRQKPCHLPCR